MSLLKCRNCTYWGETGECTRFPPQIVQDGSEPRFPMVSADMFCAEWSQNDDPGEDVTHGQLTKELINASVDLCMAWNNESDEYKVEPFVKKVQLALARLGAW